LNLKRNWWFGSNAIKVWSRCLKPYSGWTIAEAPYWKHSRKAWSLWRVRKWGWKSNRVIRKRKTLNGWDTDFERGIDFRLKVKMLVDGKAVVL
jgi:hypothetical protein